MYILLYIYIKGADLSHVYCSKDANVSIKSYSPELIVHGTILEDDLLIYIYLYTYICIEYLKVLINRSN